MSMWAYFSALKSKDTQIPLMVIKCLYEPQRASQSLYMTELRNTRFIGRIELQGGTDSMAKAINNMDDLAIALQPVMKKMVDNMANRVYETLNFFLQRYYDSYDPIFYRRQYDFLRSGFKVDTRIVRGKAVASVYIDVDYMSNYYGVTGQQVATWANEGLHGGKNLATNTPHVWDATMANTVDNGALVRDAVAYLKSQGYTVRV